MIPQFLIGIGQDSHRLVAADQGEVLTLAGVPFDCGLKLEANSDGDVIIHALYNAISTSLGGGSLGVVADKMCADGIVDSKKYLQAVLDLMSKRHYRLNNVSISVEALQPRLEKYFPYMKSSLAKICHLSPTQVGLSVTSGEGLTRFGKGEGMSVFVSVLLERE
ncbi:2-C-methyl-D-erythritol 2,4-cyclodiphosphate synthase [bacterium]|nr:2-C-methyl-D-erythritol 2,4-cyclodiphosphate synthase [bacterium]